MLCLHVILGLPLHVVADTVTACDLGFTLPEVADAVSLCDLGFARCG